MIQSSILEETGIRAGHGNLYWGMYNSSYLLFLYLSSKFIELVKNISWKEKTLQDKCFTVAGSGLLCAHLLSGVSFFLIMLFGGWYFV